MTDVLSDEATEVDATAAPALAPWGARAGAFALDVFVGLAVFASLILVAYAARQGSWLWWVCVVAGGLVLLAVAANRWMLPTATGWTMGRAVFGVEITGRDGSRPGPWRLLARDVAHLLDTAAVFIGWLWPLWDVRRRTFADILLRTESRVWAKPKRANNIAASAVAGAAVIAVLAAGLGYFTVYRQELKQNQAREQLAVQGPKLVTEMLSYRKDSLQADFDHAKTLVTDGYRPQLEEQQQAVQKRDVVDNEYWSPNATVLSATDNKGTVLVLMQGQRGTPPDYWTISATVRADFERAGDGQWKVADLTVLSKPRSIGDGG